MVKDVLTRKLLRDIREHWAQFAAAAGVVLLGTAAFVSFQLAHGSLLRTTEDFYADYNFADFFIHLERAPRAVLSELRAIEGVWQVRGRIVKDVPLEVEGHEGAVVGRIVSMPRRRDGMVNDIHIATGSYFSGAAAEEVIVNHAFAEAHGLQVGDTFKATIKEGRQQLRIVGTAYSPEYVYALRGAEQFASDDEAFGVVFATERFAEDAFQMANAFNDVVGTLRPGARVEEVLRRAERRLDRYGVFRTYDRADHASHIFLEVRLEAVQTASYIIPMVFLLVAAIVVHVIVHRMVEMQRTQIGLLCALGYTKRQVVWHYASYALAAGLAGAVPGVLLASYLARGMLGIWHEFYQFPELPLHLDSRPMAMAFVLSSGMSILGAVRSSWELMKLEPAVAIRPQPPQKSRIVHFGAFRFLWERLPLTWRMSVRNTLRARTRALFSVFGVAVSMVVLVMSVQLGGWLEWLLDHQYRLVDRSDCRVEFAAETSPAAALEIAAMRGVRRAEGIFEFGAGIRHDWRARDVGIIGLPADGRLYHVRDPDGRRIAMPPDGLIIPRRLAEELKLSPGDVVMMDPYVRDKDERPAVVRGVVDTYLGLSVYADRDYLARTLGVGPTITGALIQTDPGELDPLVSRLAEMPGVSAVTTTEALIDNFMEALSEFIDVMMTSQMIAAAVIAFGVIYNTASVSISEQERDLACLCSLGYGRGEVARIATNDIMPLGLTGIIAGSPLAYLGSIGLARALATDAFRMPMVVSPAHFFTAAAQALIFLLVARWISRRRVHRINIVRRLKTME